MIVRAILPTYKTNMSRKVCCYADLFFIFDAISLPPSILIHSVLTVRQITSAMDHDTDSDEDEADNTTSTTLTSWKKGVGDATNDRINHWSLNGFVEPVFTGGSYSKEDIRILELTVKNYCASRNVTPRELCSERHFKAVRGAWHEIAQALPHRTVLSVYRRALRQYSGHAAGEWSKEETASLARLVEMHGHKWKTIQNALGRSAQRCRCKFYDMNDEFKRGRWSEQELNLLLKSVREVLDVPRDDMDVRHINQWSLKTNSKIPWTIISFRVLRRASDCYFKWRQMTRRSNQIAANMGLEQIPMLRNSLNFDVKMEYYLWKAEKNPKWRKKYADKYIMPLIYQDGKDSQIQRDISLLGFVIQSKANLASEVSWQSIRSTMSDGVTPRERFDDLVDEYAPKNALDLPLWSLAMAVRSSYNKFINGGHDLSSNIQQKTTPCRTKKKESHSQSIRISSPAIKPDKIASNDIAGIDPVKIRDHIKEIVPTVDRDKVTVKGIRKILEKRLGIKLSKYKDEIKLLVIEVL